MTQPNNPMNNTLPEGVKERYWKLVNELRQEVPDTNQVGPVFYFGYKVNMDDTIYTVPDWGHIEKHLASELSRQREELLAWVEKEVIDLESEYPYRVWTKSLETVELGIAVDGLETFKKEQRSKVEQKRTQNV